MTSEPANLLADLEFRRQFEELLLGAIERCVGPASRTDGTGEPPRNAAAGP